MRRGRRMIAKLRGVLDSIGADSAVVDCGGVGYLVQCSRRTLSALGPVGAEVVLRIETHVREDAILLYGFAEQGEREWFRLLVTVQGVGARVALALLSVLSPDELAAAVASGDKAMLSRADGVGPKLAARIASELHERAGAIAVGQAFRVTSAASEPSSAAADAVSALVNLGYGRAEAFAVVARVSARLGADAEVAALIPAALKELGR